MAKRIKLRSVSESEKKELERLSRSRTAPQRQVERAKIVTGWLAGEKAEAIADQVGRSTATVYNQVNAFIARGMDFLDDIPRSGRPQTYTETQRGDMVVAAKTHPQQLDLPFGHWTLDRLVEYVNKQLGIPISRSQLGAILTQEGLKWYQEQPYFTESPDPQFVAKRGRS
jgi:transposase